MHLPIGLFAGLFERLDKEKVYSRRLPVEMFGPGAWLRSTPRGYVPPFWAFELFNDNRALYRRQVEGA